LNYLKSKINSKEIPLVETEINPIKLLSDFNKAMIYYSNQTIAQIREGIEGLYFKNK